MKRSLLLVTPLLVAAPFLVKAQEPAPLPPAGNQAPVLLTPPPDGAPAAPAPAAATTPAPASAKTSSTSTVTSKQEIARVQQQEIVRRQELMFKANESLALAQKAELGSNYPEARKNYLFCVEAYGSISRATANYAKSAEGLTRADLQLYNSALQAGDTKRAKTLIDEILKYNPNNALAQQKEAEITRALNNPNDTSVLGNPAVTPGFTRKVAEVQQLFIEAEQFRRTGQWDQATDRLKRILGIDPYNITATKGLEQINKEKMAYYESARMQSRDERLRQVEEKWYPPIINPDADGGVTDNPTVITAKPNFGITQKLKNTIISVDFSSGTTIEQATNALHIESVKQDPDHKGVNFIIQPEASAQAKPITLTLSNVPMDEVLRYVCQLANVKFKVQQYAISIVPFNGVTDELISRTFNVQPSFVQPPSVGGVVGSVTTGFGGGGGRPIAQPGPDTTPKDDTGGDPVKKALEAKGVKFLPGASAIYNSSTGQLTVVDTADQMELIEELVNAGQAPTNMVRIAAKFVEINQQDVNDLTINAGAGAMVLGASSTSVIGASYHSTLMGNAYFSGDGVNSLLNNTPSTVSAIQLQGFINGYQYTAYIEALSRKRSYDLVSDPAVLTKSGEQGVVEAVRVFPYPIAFDPPELVTPPQNNIQNGNAAVAVQVNPPAVIPTTPTDFKRRNVGVRLVVKPQVTADNKTIDLSLFPEVTDFEGFINYGSPINVVNPTDANGDPIDPTRPTSLLSPNVINQPVFNTRRINTKVLVRDGSTVVLGGLLRDDIQTIDDKVPVLGDLPLVGRLFQSKANQTTKRNLLIFVTAQIYRNDGELLNPPEEVNAADILTGHTSYSPVNSR